MTTPIPAPAPTPAPKPSPPADRYPSATSDQRLRIRVLLDILDRNRDVEAAIVGAEWALFGPEEEEL